MLMYNLLPIESMLCGVVLSWPRQCPLMRCLHYLYICYCSCSDPSWQPHQLHCAICNTQQMWNTINTIFTTAKSHTKNSFVLRHNNPFTDLTIFLRMSECKVPLHYYIISLDVWLWYRHLLTNTNKQYPLPGSCHPISCWRVAGGWWLLVATRAGVPVLILIISSQGRQSRVTAGI